MGVLDSVINDTGSQLGLSSNSVQTVLSGLLSFINQDEGGVGGFLDRFRRSGFGSLVTSWLSGDAKTVSADTVETALGHQTIDRIGEKAGLSFSTAASAIALMLPKIVGRLAPGGTIPARLSSEFTSYITAAPAAVAAGARQAVSAAGTMAQEAGLGRYLWPILGVLLLGLLLAMWLLNRGTVNNAAFNVAEQLRLATQRASAALAALRPGFTAQELVTALNLEVINFPTGSAQIPNENYEFLNKAAAAFKAAPAGVVVDIGGHTDNTGDPAANRTLSQQRADAVRAYLVQQGVSPGMLTATGYGDTKPVAGNDTDAGRFRNRRIEFTVR
ncbi:MAG TPA: OmpA family protein [Vicinamibacterales bacterium]|nr:OmpA family protein [Vicinamibacterales bacterium]